MVRFNTLYFALLFLFFFRSAVRWLLNRLNIRHLRYRSGSVPEPLQGDIDEATLRRMVDYTVDSSRLGCFEALMDDLLTAVLVFAGVLPLLWAPLSSFHLPSIVLGLAFFGLLGLIFAFWGLPFEFYRTFVIEKKYGFSTITYGLWLLDLLKGLVLSAVLAAILLGAVLFLIQWAAGSWWLWAWLFFIAFQLLLLWLYPLVIVPIFNKCEPVADRELRQAIVDLMEKVGLKAEGVYKIDAGKRSKHTNAYFSGLGKTKRIILFDTLLAAHTTEEILAVLAHEAGHWKGKHIAKQFIFIGLWSFVLFYILYRLMGWPLLYHTFGFEQINAPVGLFLLSVLGAPILYFLSPALAFVTRKFEKEADDFASLAMGSPRPMIEALKRIARDNLANLYPHPLFVWFYYSHPPVLERIERLIRLR